MFYHISKYNPSPGMSASGFNIELFPEFKNLVKEANISQEEANTAVANLSPIWLMNHGYDKTFYEGQIRVRMGVWGLEHISVPGNACGLDITNYSLGVLEGSALLAPHNVDSIKQASLLLTVFLWYADFLMTEWKYKKLNEITQ